MLSERNVASQDFGQVASLLDDGWTSLGRLLDDPWKPLGSLLEATWKPIGSLLHNCWIFVGRPLDEPVKTLGSLVEAHWTTVGHLWTTLVGHLWTTPGSLLEVMDDYWTAVGQLLGESYKPLSQLDIVSQPFGRLLGNSRRFLEASWGTVGYPLGDF